MCSLRITAFDAVIAQGSFDDIKVFCWEDCIADAGVNDGVLCLNTSKVSLALTGVQTSMIHSECPVVLILANFTPENVFLRQTCLCIRGKVIAAKSNAAIFLWRLTQEEAEHGLERVLLTKLVNFLKLLHETFELVISAHGCKTDDTSKPIVLDTRWLVSLQNF